MVKLSKVFSILSPIKALVIGDLMLDKYTTGKVQRISPEAPVTILEVEEEHILPGGAGNVILNLIALGAEVKVLGRIGKDSGGASLKHLLKKEHAQVDGILVQENYFTPVKNRLIAQNQQMMRIDFERIKPISTTLEQQIVAKLDDLIASVDIVAISDYGKGFLSNSLLEAVIERCRKLNIAAVVDPKGIDFNKYAHAYMVKPNLKEAYLASRLSFDEPIEKVAKVLLKMTQSKYLMITRSENGITLFDHKKKRVDFPAKARQVKDSTGAGDTVLAVTCFALANKLDIEQTANLANLAAGISVEKLGCAKISLVDMAERLLHFDLENKIFDETHVHVLKKYLENKPFILFGLSSQKEISLQFVQQIKRMSQKALAIAYVKDKNPNEDFLHFLASINEINFVIAHRDNLKKLCQNLIPKEVFTVKNSSWVKVQTFDQLL